ncbi:diguanylate cyclase domain-containing protein [Tepidimonas charontis]|uniref:Diguanylate cyclase DosC n=1 Tax=Tepidimonas charontis TaxID=2267262 RepID=A0A554XFK6_9BURK|nr:diguanylate cyclase [Tepidimonas charontis]TSE34559.1 Diguanylate cyclase DosC [Tepidimonas charontis]
MSASHRTDTTAPSSDRVGGLAHPALLGLVADWLWEMDASLRVVRVEPLAEAPKTPPLPRLIGQRPWESPALVYAGQTLQRRWRPLWLRQPFRGLELQWRTRGDRPLWTSISGVPRFDAQGQFTGYIGVAQDITTRKRLEQRLQRARAELHATLQALPDLLFEIDGDGVYRRVHAPRPELLLVPPDQLLGRRLDELLPPEVLTIAQQAMEVARRQRQVHGLRYRLTIGGEERWFELSMARVAAAGAPERFVAVVRDITELSMLAFFDALTGLPNRRLLLDRLQQALLRQQRRPTWAALLFIDLDDFKRINDQHGHAAGDAVLVTLCRRMREQLRRTDTLARYGGDEFVAVLEGLGRSQGSARRNVERLVGQVRAALTQPIDGVVPGEALNVSASVGGVLFWGAVPVQALLQRADSGVYRAKEGGKNRASIEMWVVAPSA